MSREEQHDYIITDEKAQLAKRRMVLAIALQMTLPGTPAIYYGDEAEMLGYADPFNRAPMNWGNPENETINQIKIFTELRGKTPSLRTGLYTPLYARGGVISFMRNLDNGLDAFGKECTGSDIIVIINSSDKGDFISVSLEELHVDRITDALSGNMISQSSSLELELAPLSYRLLIPERRTHKCTKIQST